MVNKERLIKGLSYLAYAFPFIFGGPMLMHYALQVDSTLYTVIAALLMLTAMYLGTKGIMTAVESVFGKRK